VLRTSINLSKRLTNYFNYSYITDPRRNMLIHKALLKYGYSKFLLEILEYCDPSDVLVREQYYIDVLKPEYNILKKAGSSLGFNHITSGEEKKVWPPAGMKEIALNRSSEAAPPCKAWGSDEEYKAKLREHLAKLNGRKMPCSAHLWWSEIRAKITSPPESRFNKI